MFAKNLCFNTGFFILGNRGKDVIYAKFQTSSGAEGKPDIKFKKYREQLKIHRGKMDLRLEQKDLC